jgi:hypothetical protein
LNKDLLIGQLVEVDGEIMLDDTCPLGRIVEMDTTDRIITTFYKKVEMFTGDRYYVFRTNLTPKVEAGPGLEVYP